MKIHYKLYKKTTKTRGTYNMQYQQRMSEREFIYEEAQQYHGETNESL